MSHIGTVQRRSQRVGRRRIKHGDSHSSRNLKAAPHIANHRFVDREQEATESVLRSRSDQEPTMTIYPASPKSAADGSPPPARGPEMYQLDPLHEIRDQPRCEIGDLPSSTEDEPAPATAGKIDDSDAASSDHSRR